MQSFGNVTISNVATGGDLTQLYPDNVVAGSGSTASQTSRRYPSGGVLYRVEINPKDAVGGIFELWDLAGESQGASNNVDTGTAMTAAYLASKIARGKAKLLWTIDFKGDSGLNNKVFGVRVVYSQGLAGRYINDLDAVGSKLLALNIVSEGGFRVSNIQ